VQRNAAIVDVSAFGEFFALLMVIKHLIDELFGRSDPILENPICHSRKSSFLNRRSMKKPAWEGSLKPVMRSKFFHQNAG
jgi:hypothetical protein